MTNQDRIFFDRAEVARRVGISPATIWREQRAGRFPEYQRLSARRVGLRASDLQEWLEGRRDWSGAR